MLACELMAKQTSIAIPTAYRKMGVCQIEVAVDKHTPPLPPHTPTFRPVY